MGINVVERLDHSVPSRILVWVAFAQAEERLHSAGFRCVTFISIVADEQNIRALRVDLFGDPAITFDLFLAASVSVEPMVKKMFEVSPLRVAV